MCAASTLARALGSVTSYRPPMSIVTCPTEIVAATPSVVWQLATTPAELARWTDSTLIEPPDHSGELRRGDRVVLGAGVRGLFRVRVDVVNTDPPKALSLDVHLPFGVINHEVLVITPVFASSCRVTFN